MKKLLFLFIIFSYSLSAQDFIKFNFDFELKERSGKLPIGWFKWGTYDIDYDTVSWSGKYAGKVFSHKNDGTFGSIVYAIPANYKGDKIRLEGYMKTKKVKGGHAGLLLRLNGEKYLLGFDIMEKQKIRGTNDWEKYVIEMDYTQEVKEIYLGGYLSGTGEAWFDNFELYIDDVNINDIKAIQAEMPVNKFDNTYSEDSYISILNPQKINVKNLAFLCKIWGFLKYHHPIITKGKYNWDFELFRILRDYKKIKSEKLRDEFLMIWINSLGEVKEQKRTKKVSQNAFLKPDLTFIQNEEMSDELRERLKFIYENRYQGKNYYVKSNSKDLFAQFINENPYSQHTYPDDGYRLLSLFRFWNSAQYFYPYKYQTENWEATLREFIPVFLSAKNELEYKLAVLRLIGELKESRPNVLEKDPLIEDWKGSYYPPFQAGFVQNKLIVTRPIDLEKMNLSELKPGDIITEINGRKTEEWYPLLSKYYPSSNKSAQNQDISVDILRFYKNELQIKFLRDTLELETYLQLYPKDSILITESNADESTAYRILQEDIGYLFIADLNQDNFSDAKSELKDLPAVILDLRSSSVAINPYELSSFFISRKINFYKFTSPNPENPGEFLIKKGEGIKPERKHYDKKLIVLINEKTRGLAELIALILQNGEKTLLLGSSTAGTQGDATQIYLPGGIPVSFSGLGIYHANEKEIQQTGIIPDIEVHPTIDGIKKGKDELLERAIDVILNNKQNK